MEPGLEESLDEPVAQRRQPMGRGRRRDDQRRGEAPAERRGRGCRARLVGHGVGVHAPRRRLATCARQEYDDQEYDDQEYAGQKCDDQKYPGQEATRQGEARPATPLIFQPMEPLRWRTLRWRTWRTVYARRSSPS